MMTMRIRLGSWLGAVLGFLAGPALALAEDAETAPNARLEGFTKSVKVDPASTTLLWLLVVVLAVICLAVMFKDAKRTHLD